MSNLNVAIYGISSYSINLMRNLNGVIIKGFIDNENSGKFIELYPIFSIYDVKKNNINVIIIPDIIDKNIEIYKNVIDYQKNINMTYMS